MSPELVGILCTVAGTSFCGTAQMAGKTAVKYFPPVKMCAVRYAMSAVMCYMLGVMTTGRYVPQIGMRDLGVTVLISLMAWGIGAFLFFTAMQKDSMHRVTPLSNSISIWATVLSIVFLGEKFFPALGVAMLLLIVGIPMMTPGKGAERRWKWAMPAAFAVSVLWAFSIILTKLLISDINYVEFVYIKMVVAAAFHIVASMFVKEKSDYFRGLKFIVLSAVALIVGDTLLMAGVDRLPASVFSPVFATIIPFGFLGSIIFLGEKPIRRNWVGMLLIFAAAGICGYYGAR